MAKEVVKKELENLLRIIKKIIVNKFDYNLFLCRSYFLCLVLACLS